LLSACSSGLVGSGSSAAPATSSPSGAKAGYGYLKVTISAVASWALEAGTKAGSSSQGMSRALLVADSVTLTVMQGTTTVYAWSESPVNVNGSASNAGSPNSYTSTQTPSLPVGAYSLNVSVFNAENPGTAPVVSGTASFTITNGNTATPVVVCAPVNPTPVVLGTPLSGIDLGLPWSYSGGAYVSHGEENWYQFTAGSVCTAVTVAPSAVSGDIPAFGVFDRQGRVLGYTGGKGLQLLTADIPTTSGRTYYVAAFDTAGGAASNGTVVLAANEFLYTISTVPTGSLTLVHPAAIAFDSAGDLFIADDANNAIDEVSASGVASVAVGTPGTPGYMGDSGYAASAELDSPQDIAFDGAGNLYIADTGNKAIREVSGPVIGPASIITTCAINGSPGVTLSSPKGLAFDKSGDLYISDTGNNAIYEISSAGVFSQLSWPSSAPALNMPMGIAFDGFGNLYIADSGNSAIRELSDLGQTNETVSTVAGILGKQGYSGDGGLAAAAELGSPYGIAFDSSGNLYYADNIATGTNGRSCVREACAGVINTVVGSGSATSPANAQTLASPGRIAFYGGDLYVADSGDGLIREVAP